MNGNSLYLELTVRTYVHRNPLSVMGIGLGPFLNLVRNRAHLMAHLMVFIFYPVHTGY